MTKPLRKVVSRSWRHANKYVALLDCGHRTTQTDKRGKKMAESVRCGQCDAKGMAK